METPINISLLDNVDVASPCTARWEEMVGDDRTRHCSHCSMNVYNLSGMTRDEAETLVASAEGRLCIRFHRRADGTILTQDCPVGLRTVRQRLLRSIRNIGATVATVVASFLGWKAYAQPSYTQGGLVAPPIVDTTATQTAATQDTAVQKKEMVEDERPIIMGEMAVAPRLSRHREATVDSTAVEEKNSEETEYFMGDMVMTDNPETQVEEQAEEMVDGGAEGAVVNVTPGVPRISGDGVDRPGIR